METINIAENKEGSERGENVQVRVKFIRHGERTPEGELTDHGREITEDQAVESDEHWDDYHAVKAVGSDAGLSSGAGARALETADIYAKEIDEDEKFNTRVESILNYETLINPIPYDHKAMHTAALPENFDTLSDEEKAKASKIAQVQVIDNLMSMDTKEAEDYRKEIAGSFAHVVLHYCDMAQRLYSGSKVLIPAGAHGGTMEMLLREALVRKNAEGDDIVGFNKTGEIGGEFDPSEAYNIDVKTDEDGALKKLQVSFDNLERELPDGMYLDFEKVQDLAEYYDELHNGSDKESAV